MMKCLKNQTSVKQNKEKIKLNCKYYMVPKKKSNNKNKILGGFKIRLTPVKGKVKVEQV